MSNFINKLHDEIFRSFLSEVTLNVIVIIMISILFFFFNIKQGMQLSIGTAFNHKFFLLAIFFALIFSLVPLIRFYNQKTSCSNAELRNNSEIKAELSDIWFHAVKYRRKLEKAKEILTAILISPDKSAFITLLERILNEIEDEEPKLLESIKYSNERLNNYNIYIPSPLMHALAASEFLEFGCYYNDEELLKIERHLNLRQAEITTLMDNINEILTPKGEWNNKGWTLTLQGKYHEAIQAYETAIKIDPEYVEAWNNKGWTLTLQGKYHEAIQAYETAIKIDPEYVEAWNNKGWTLTLQGKYREAIQDFDKSLQLNPNYAKAYYWKGNALNALGKKSESKAAFAKAKELEYTG